MLKKYAKVKKVKGKKRGEEGQKAINSMKRILTKATRC
jgi:hypothetical protein